MAIYVYVTDRCKREAEESGMSEALTRFADRIQKSQQLNAFDPFPAGFYVKKKFHGRQGRLVGKSFKHGDHLVLCLFSILTQHDTYNNRFVADPEGYARQCLYNEVTKEQMELFADEKAKLAIPARTAMQDSEYEYLYSSPGAATQSDDDFSVFETAEWTRVVGRPEIKERLFVIGEKMHELQTEGGAPAMRSHDCGRGLIVDYAVFPDIRMLVLLRLRHPGGAPAEIPDFWTTAVTRGSVDKAELLRRCRRSYPHLVLFDDDLWRQIQKETEGNLALSPEEADILAMARSMGAFPLFINGRAGSGKSTILQYLFADHIHAHLSRQWVGLAPPFYFTCSEGLLLRARSTVESILKCRVDDPAAGGDRKLSERAAGLLAGAFKEFHKYLYSLLTEAEQRDKFPWPMRIGLSRYKQMWHKRFGREPRAIEEYGPDLSWHIIRTYIKGLCPDDLTNADEYELIDRRQRTVTKEAYRTVHEKVWQRWYEDICTSGRFWDDQDLVRYLIENDRIRPVASGIFCDEVQDFSRLELEVLLRLSVYSDRELDPRDIDKVPFVFAGDQFQTLNPTGFRWQSIKATFVEKFVHALDPSEKSGKTDLKYKELTYNYRSCGNIVRLSNYAQLIRCRLFHISDKEIQPQVPWAPDSGMPAIWYKATDSQFWENVTKEEDVVIIVPCEEGEEAQYVGSQASLKHYVKVEEGVPRNVFSAARAKGLEFGRVIVYGFGEAAPAALMDPLTNGTEHTSDLDRALPMEYFFNRLYVAVSRAKRRLFVVDTNDGFQQLWKHFGDDASARRILEWMPADAPAWRDEVGYLTEGVEYDLSGDRNIDSLENARVFEEAGRERRDPMFLRNAALSYKSAGDINKYRDCMIEALLIEDRFVDAGNLYAEAGETIKAVDCFWSGGRTCWDRILQAASKDPKIVQTLEYRFVSSIKQSEPAANVLKNIQELKRRLDDESTRDKYLGDPAWPAAFNETVGQILNRTLKDVPWVSIASAVDGVVKHGFGIEAERLGHLYRKASRFEDALRVWEEAGIKPKEYSAVAASGKRYPDNLIYLSELGRHDEILNQYDSNRDVALANEIRKIVGAAYLRKGRLREAIPLYAGSADAEGLMEVAQVAFNKSMRGVASHAVGIIPAALILGGRWEPIINYVNGGNFVAVSDRAARFRKWFGLQEQMIRDRFVRAFARYEASAELTVKQSSRLSDFLKEHYIDRMARVSPDVALEIGVAIERAGRVIDALEYYEKVQKLDMPDDGRRQAAMRWIKCKERQIEYEERQGRRNVVLRYTQEVVARRRDIGMRRDEAIQDLPTLSPLDELFTGYLRAPVEESDPASSRQAAAETPATAGRTDLGDRTEYWLGSLKIRVFKKKRRINIEHQETGDTMSYDLVREEAHSADMTVQKRLGSKWYCEEWNLTLDTEKYVGDRRIDFIVGPTNEKLTLKL